MFQIAIRRNRTRGVREILALMLAAALAFSGLAVISAPPAEASGLSAVTKMCRSTDGAGNTYQTSTTSNGYFQEAGLRITPIFTKRMYVDGSRNFDASYIGYRVTNTGASALSNLVVELTGFTGGVVSPVTDADSSRRIGTLAASATANVYFLLKATGPTTVNQRHDFRVFTDDGVTKTQQTACYTEILGVKRSLSASANKVTSIAVNGTPQLGQTLTITVKGAPGKVGSGENTGDGSIMALSPASNSSWPTRALRLENVQVIVTAVPNNVANNASAACFVGTNDGFGADTTNVSYSSGTKKLTVNNRLVLRNFGSCATTTKQTYEAIYTFRVIGPSATNPAIFPLASISSGTQIKYTGSLPASTTTVPLTGTTYPLNVTKTYVSSVADLGSGTVDVTYRITASSSASANFEEFRDEPDAAATFVSASFTDSSAGGTRTPTQVNVGTLADPIWRFKASSSNAATNFTVTSSTSAILTYVVRYPIPAESKVYRNLGYVLQNDVKIGSSGLTTGIDATVSSDGGVSGAPITEKVPQKIAFDPAPTLGQNSSMEITGYSDSTLPVSFTASPDSICGVKEQNGVWTLFALGEGNCLVTASQGGNSTFEAAPDVTRTVKILKGQIITGNAGSFSGNTASVEVFATSKLPVTLTSLDTDICELTVGTAYNASTGVTIYTATKGPLVQANDGGTCLMVASQDGVPLEEESVQIWGPAPDKDLRIGFGSAQFLRFLSSNPTEPTDGFLATTTSFTVTFTSVDTDGGSNRTGLPVSLQSLTPNVCSVRLIIVDDEIRSGYDGGSKDTTLTIDRVGSGVCTLSASQDGNDDLGDATSFAPATNITRSFNWKSAGNLTQYVSFDSIASVTYGDPSFFVFAASSSNASSLDDTTLLVAISSTSESVCQVGASSRDGTKSKAEIFIVGAGTCSLSGLQSGNDTYKLETATTSFVVLKKQLSVVGLSGVSREYDGTRNSSFTGTPALIGVVPGDGSEQVRVVGPGSIAQFSQATVGSESLALDDFTLEGSKASSSYTIIQPTVTGTITTRAITIKFNDRTVEQTPEYTCGTSSVSVSVGSIVATEELSSIACSGLPSFGTGYSDGISSVTPSSAVIITKSGGLATTSNYVVTYQAGDFTVTSLILPVLEAPDLEVVYGTLTVQTEGANSDSGPNAKKVRAKNGANFVAGSVSQKINGQALNANLGAGEYVVDVEFTPSEAGFAKVTSTREIKVLPRKLFVNNISITSKPYDGSRAATISGSPQLAADPDDPIQGLGVIPGDNLTLTDLSSALFEDANVGSHSVAVIGLSLSGTKAANYLLRVPSFTANINKRTLKLAPEKASYSKLANESDPELNWKLLDGTTFASGENEDTIGGVTISRASGNTARITPYTISLSVGNASGKDNYEVSTQTASLYIASLTINISETDGELDSNQVECDCVGLKPGSEITLTMFSTPTVITTATVSEDGTCPGLQGTLPANSSGSHTLELSSNFPNDDSAAINRPILFPTPTTPAPTVAPTVAPVPNTDPAPGNGPISGPPSGGVSNGAAPSTPPAGNSSNGSTAGGSAGSNSSGGSSTGGNQASGSTGGSTGSSGSRPIVPILTGPITFRAPALPGTFTGSGSSSGGNPISTVDLGDGIQSASGLGTPASNQIGTRTVGQLAQEKIGGFASGTGLVVEVLGSRTGARFTLTNLGAINTATLLQAIENSIPAQGTDFSQIKNVSVASGAVELNSWSTEFREGSNRYFEAVGLDRPQALSDIDLSNVKTWLNVSAEVKTYQPGSTVFLVATSTPIVIGVAEVDRFGNAILDGFLPVEALGAGEHRIRVVGTRSFSGVSVDSNGEVQITQDVLEQIQLFDLGTQATIAILGEGQDGGYHSAKRVIPLVPVAPWWTLCIIAGVFALISTIRFYGRRPIRAYKSKAASAVIVSAIPAVILGWLSTVTEVVWSALALAIALGAAATFVPSKGKHSKSKTSSRSSSRRRKAF